MKSNFVKQVILCILIICIVGIMAFGVRDYFFPQENNHSLTNTNKETYSYNEFQIINVTTEVLIQRYFQDFKDKMLYTSEEAYQLLETSTLEKFRDKASFESFVNDHFDLIFQSTITKYTTQTTKSSNKYIIVDQFDNQYTFIASAVLVYKVDIDYSSNF